jgi:hypothetical protein
MNIYKYPIITEPNIFESLVTDYLNYQYGTTSFQKLGRKGQKQYGIDIISIEYNYAVQCKVISNTPRTKSQRKSIMSKISDDIIAAYNSHLPVNKLIVATTLPRDVNYYGKESPLFYVSTLGMIMLEFWSWDDICDGIASFSILLNKYFKNFLPNLAIASLQVLPKSIYKKTETGKRESFGHSFYYQYQNRKGRNHLPIFDVSIINNSDETVLLTSIDVYAERTAAMAGCPSKPIGELTPYKKYKIKLPFNFNHRYKPNKTTLEFDNPIYLYPKAPLRIQLQGDNAINAPSRVRFLFNFNSGTIMSDYIYFEIVSSSMMPIMQTHKMLVNCLTETE